MAPKEGHQFLAVWLGLPLVGDVWGQQGKHFDDRLWFHVSGAVLIDLSEDVLKDIVVDLFEDGIFADILALK